jgi:carbamoyl-phosphate synthase large subunit
MIGASREAIDKAEDREKFKQAMTRIGLASARSSLAHSMEEALQVQASLGYPVVIRPSFTLGGTGGGIAYNREEFVAICERGIEASPTHELLIEESLIGWKEFEMEVVRDKADNCIIVCSIENLDPMGVHTGDSITVAPSQTLTDKEYQILRDASIAVLREIGVDTGGSNVQFAINPKDGRMVVIEMNPRVSRSSALASKATGFPIAKVAAKLAVGYTLDEVANEVTGGATPASFEPTIDYVVVKVPRFAFEKFPQANDRLTTQMKSVGEVMAIGRTFQESFQKALRGLEGGRRRPEPEDHRPRDAGARTRRPGPERIWYVGDAFENGFTMDEVHRLTHIDPWFLAQIKEIVDLEMELDDQKLDGIGRRNCGTERKGFSDRRLAYLFNTNEKKSGEKRTLWHIVRSTSASTPAPRSSRRAPPTCTPPTRRSARPSRRDRRRSWCWAAGRTASGRASSSTTAACTRRWRCARTASRPSWSTAIRRRCRPTTTPPTGCTSSRSRWRTCSRSSAPSYPNFYHIPTFFLSTSHFSLLFYSPFPFPSSYSSS